MRRKRVLICALVCASMAVVGVANASAETLYVSNTVPVKGSGKSCSEPGYSKVQAAVTAALAGATIDICAGTYTEQVEIEKAIKLNGINGAGTATLAMPATPTLSKSACDVAELENHEKLEQWDEISICTAGAVSLTNLTVEAEIPVINCATGLYGIFVGGGGTLKATTDTIVGASTTENGGKGCQQGVAVEVGLQKFSAPPHKLITAEVGHAVLKAVSVSGYQKNGPTAKGAGSTLSVSSSTITGVGESPYIAQNGIEVGLGAKATIGSSTVSGNECNVASCGAHGEQASGVLFASAAPGSKITGSHIKENDLGVYYASESSVVPEKPEVTVSTDVLTANRYEGVLLEEGKAALTKDTISGPGRVGIDLFQASYQLSPSESSASYTRIEGQSEAAIIVESDKSAKDPPGKFKFLNGTESGNGTFLINESSNFVVIL